MSELREVKINIDPTVWEETVTELGYRVYRDVNIRGYSTQHIKGEIVIEVQPGFGIGLKEGKLIYDDWRGICDKHLQDIIPTYYEKLLKKRMPYANIQAKHNNKTFVFVIRS
jgi:hypothetical protein